MFGQSLVTVIKQARFGLQLLVVIEANMVQISRLRL